MATRKPTKEKKKAKKKGIKGNGYSKNLSRTYPGSVGLPFPEQPGTNIPGQH